MDRLDQAVSAAVWAQLSEEYSNLDDKMAARVAGRLYQWLSEKARKKPVPDLDERLLRWRLLIEKLARELVIKVDGQHVRVASKSGSQDVLVCLDKGTDWFDGHPDLAREIALAVFNQD